MRREKLKAQSSEHRTQSFAFLLPGTVNRKQHNSSIIFNKFAMNRINFMAGPSLLLTPEEKLLLSLCRLTFSEDQKSEIGEFIKEVRDWDHFVGLSNKHGIIALTWHHLNNSGKIKCIPPGNLNLLYSAYLKSLTRNTFLYNQLVEAASLASSKNIKIVLLKGLALERVYYCNNGLRQMSDIDILVRQNEAALLRRKLLENGFESAPLVSSFHERIMPAYGKHLPELYKNGIAVEIHFKLFDQKENSLTEELIDSALPLPGNITNIYYPNPQLFFLYLVRHLVKHEKTGFSQLRLYTDLAVLLSVNSDQILNEKLFEYAKRVNLENGLAEKLFLLNFFWGISVPKHIETFFEGFEVEKVKEEFISSLRHPQNDQQDEEQESLFKLLKDVPGINNKLLLLLGHIFPSLAYVKYRYKIKTTTGAVLYYPVRWVTALKSVVPRRKSSLKQ